MKINYVAYLNPFEYSGGGELSMRRILETGTNLGHRIKISSVYSSYKIDLFKKADLYFLADIYNAPIRFKPRKLKRYFKTEFINNIIRNEKYIHFDNAYCDVCDMPDYLPCNGQIEGERCPFKTKWLFWHTKKCFRVFTKKMYQNSQLNVFVSPLHRRTVQKIMGNNVIEKYYEAKPLIDLKQFYNFHKERDIDNLFAGVICEAKGIDNMKRQFPKENIVLIGKSGKGDDNKYGKRVGFVPYEKMSEYFNRAKYFVFLPRWPEPQGRVVVEAALCGCNLITNGNVGAVSFDFDIAYPQNIINAEIEFWDAIERVFKNGK